MSSGPVRCQPAGRIHRRPPPCSRKRRRQGSALWVTCPGARTSAISSRPSRICSTLQFHSFRLLFLEGTLKPARRRHVGRGALADQVAKLRCGSRLILWFVLATQRTTTRRDRRHPRGWSSATFTLAHRQACEYGNCFVKLFAFVVHLGQHFSNVHISVQYSAWA